MSIKYQAYQGPKDFVFIRGCKEDERLLNEITQKLIDRKIRVFYDLSSTKRSHSQEDIASAILNSSLCIFVLSKKAADSLDLRNSINYALSLKKDVVCIRKDEGELSHGLDMQLSNITFFRNSDELVEYIQKKYESCIGEGQILSSDDKQKKVLAVALIALAGLLLLGSIMFISERIRYFNSAEYQLGKIDDVEYLDFTSFSQDDLVYLKGKKIDEINFKDMDIDSIKGIEEVQTETVDLSGNPRLKNVNPIIMSDTIKTVMISQDMIRIADTLYSAGIEVVVTR
ncbi:MAG: toll/interleukin-1 receptor domain-containing protein [Erysipelotrichaceae bacterium]|nr:toll/interleukin-1 receptor domain-containing protein [Erysipelotrichaceae bacterium]